MLFNSYAFAVFFLLFFAIYWSVQYIFKENKTIINTQNIITVIGSYIFYGFWDWRFLILIFFSSNIDFIVGNFLAKTEDVNKRKLLLYTSLGINLGLLGVFKYYDFFITSFSELITNIGFQSNLSSLNLILPVGISFYTFQTLSYTIDIYRKEMEPAKNYIGFLAFVSFFPQLVAGPIERAADLYPQFIKKRFFDYDRAISGVKMIMLGLFKKLVISDKSAQVVNEIYANYETASGGELLIAALYFSFQIYGDFSGYTDIAIGTSRLIGFDLKTNFNLPYISKNMTEHWRRWHISLSTWIKDYLFTPLSISFRNLGNNGIALALIITFTLNGLWHGANWTFIVWGAIHGIALAFEIFTKKRRKKIRKNSRPFFYNNISLLLTFLFWTGTLILFRAPNIDWAFSVIGKIFSNPIIELSSLHYIKLLPILLLYFLFEKVQQNEENILNISRWIKSKWLRYIFYYGFIFITFYFAGNEQEFIYFQF